MDGIPGFAGGAVDPAAQLFLGQRREPVFVQINHEGQRRWRVEVKPDGIVHLVDEQRILGEFEALNPMGLQSESAPDAVDPGLGQTAALGHRAGASASLIP